MVADFRIRTERFPAQAVLLNADLSRAVVDLARDLEQFDSSLQSQRRLLQRAGGHEPAVRRRKEIRAEVARITTKVRSVLNGIALTDGDS